MSLVVSPDDYWREVHARHDLEELLDSGRWMDAQTGRALAGERLQAAEKAFRGVDAGLQGHESRVLWGWIIRPAGYRPITSPSKA